MWPGMTVIGTILEKYHRDPHLPFHASVTSLNMILDKKINSDKDCKFKQVMLAFIAATSRIEIESNFWNSRASVKIKSYPGFGRCAKEREMKAFVNAMPLMCNEERYWFHDKKDLPWDVFSPVIDNWNRMKRRTI